MKKLLFLLVPAAFVIHCAGKALCLTIGEIAAASALVTLVVDPGMFGRSLIPCAPGENPAACHAGPDETVPSQVRYPATGEAFSAGVGINRTPIPSAYDRQILP